MGPNHFPVLNISGDVSINKNDLKLICLFFVLCLFILLTLVAAISGIKYGLST